MVIWESRLEELYIHRIFRCPKADIMQLVENMQYAHYSKHLFSGKDEGEMQDAGDSDFHEQGFIVWVPIQLLSRHEASDP